MQAVLEARSSCRSCIRIKAEITYWDIFVSSLMLWVIRISLIALPSGGLRYRYQCLILASPLSQFLVTLVCSKVVSFATSAHLLRSYNDKLHSHESLTQFEQSVVSRKPGRRSKRVHVFVDGGLTKEERNVRGKLQNKVFRTSRQGLGGERGDTSVPQRLLLYSIITCLTVTLIEVQRKPSRLVSCSANGFLTVFRWCCFQDGR